MDEQPVAANSRDCPALFETDLRLPDRRRGKVRDTYEIDLEHGPELLVIATDRLSAFDVVMPTPIPGKGVLLTEIAAWWLRWIEARRVCATYLRTTDAGEIPGSAFEGSGTERADLEGRVTIGRRCRVLPIECVVRGYLEGSGWKDYQQTGGVCGIELPSGLRQCERLPEPIFTPATKAEQGEHDENISFERASETVGGEMMAWLREVSVRIYTEASLYALERGIIIADTKFEFGLPLREDGSVDELGEPMLIDEALTPDSSRFWPADDYEPGRAQKSFDKQFVREYLEGLVSRGEWDKTAPGPELPEDVVGGTLARYREARDRLCG